MHRHTSSAAHSQTLILHYIFYILHFTHGKLHFVSVVFNLILRASVRWLEVVMGRSGSQLTKGSKNKINNLKTSLFTPFSQQPMNDESVMYVHECRLVELGL